MADPVLRVSDLRKRFGALLAVDGVAFEVAAGEIFGLLGPNGAGKTTTISCIAGLLRPDGGAITVAGADVGLAPAEVKARLGLVPQDLALYDELTVEANLRAFGSLYPGLGGARLAERVAWCLGFVELADHAGRPVAELSGGMKRRLNLAVALLHDPALVLCDEPTVGVDPQSRNHIFGHLEALARQGKAIVYTTHYMEEVERLCPRAAIVDHGRVIAVGPLAELLLRADHGRRVRLRFADGVPDPDLAASLAERFQPVRQGWEGGELVLAFAGQVPITELVTDLAARGRPPVELGVERPTLEDAFLTLTGRRLRDG
jgi:ABC-2 type transport system ATP-binding protein